MHDYKKMSRLVAHLHGRKGGCTYELVPPRTPEVRMLLAEAKHPRVLIQGPRLSPKQIRRFLWDNRNHRAVYREGAVLWTCWDPDKGVSEIGLAKRMPLQASGRLGTIPNVEQLR